MKQEKNTVQFSEIRSKGCNDIEMLDSVGEPYVMEKAVDDIKLHGKYTCYKVEDTLINLMNNGTL